MDMLLNLIGGALGKAYAILASVIAVLGAGVGLFFAGKKSERKKQRIKDHERAGEIRDNVRRTADERMRELDDAGYRD